MPTSRRKSEQILFFSRGLGRGHAVPDAAIADELYKLRPNIDIIFCSYSLGAVTLRQLNQKVIDLELPEENSIWEVTTAAIQVFRKMTPTVVVAHEEFAVLPAAHGFGLASIFLTDWFGNPEWPNMQCMKYADAVIFLDDPGFDDVPEYVREKICYSGSVFRSLDPVGSREECRVRLGLPRDAIVVLVLPGGAGFHSEARAPLVDLMLPAFRALKKKNKRLLWVAGDVDWNYLREKTAGQPDVSILKPHSDLTTTMKASNLVITKGNRTPLLECNALGIPSLSISYGHNFVDDGRIARIPANTPLRARGLSPATLRDRIVESIDGARILPCLAPDEIARGRSIAAQRISAFIDRTARKSNFRESAAGD